MRIGRLVEKEDGNIAGRVQTLTLDQKFALTTMAEAERRSSEAPTHEIKAKAAHGGVVVIGAATVGTIEHGENAGKRFYKLRLDDPSFEATLWCFAWPTDRGDHDYDIDWKRPRGLPTAQEVADNQARMDRERNGAAPPAGGGDLDDEIPF